MGNLPVDFVSHTSASGEFSKPWQISSSQSQAACAIPSEFGGQGGGFSPEDLFLQSMMNCFAGTFKVYANGSRVTFSNLSVKGTLTVDKNPEATICMKKCLLEIEILGVEKPDRARTLVAKALREGFILNSVKTEVEAKLSINGEFLETTN